MSIQVILLAFWATVLKIISTYLFRDWEFLKWIAVLIVVDTVLGMVQAWREHAFSSLGFSKFFVKIAMYGAGLIVTNVLYNFTIRGEHPTVLDWFAYFMLVGMVIRESISVLEKIAVLEPRLLPTWVLPRLKALDYQIGDKTFDRKPDINAPN